MTASVFRNEELHVLLNHQVPRLYDVNVSLEDSRLRRLFESSSSTYRSCALNTRCQKISTNYLPLVHRTVHGGYKTISYTNKKTILKLWLEIFETVQEYLVWTFSVRGDDGLSWLSKACSTVRWKVFIDGRHYLYLWRGRIVARRCWLGRDFSMVNCLINDWLFCCCDCFLHVDSDAQGQCIYSGA